MSISLSPSAVEPKRKRGHERVAAIIEAATHLFAERGYAAVTMTEIAARSSTAIGSLYRFFPTKDALAAALMQRYGMLLGQELQRIVDSAAGLSQRHLALLLVRMIRSLKEERASALAMIDAQENSAALRSGVRQQMLEGLSAILNRRFAQPIRHEVDPGAWMLLYALKAIRQLDQDRPELADRLEEDAVRLIEVYLSAPDADRPAEVAPAALMADAFGD